MNPNPTDPSNEATVPETTPASAAPEITEVPIEPMTPTSSEAPVAPVEPMTPTSPAVPAATPDVLFPASPQVTPAPEATAPVSPIGSGVTAAPTPEPKKSKKKLLTIIGAIGGVVLLAVIGALLYVTLSGASAEDYREATTQYNTTSSANSSLTRNVGMLTAGLGSDTDDEFNTAVKDAEDSLAKLKDENAKFGDLKAVNVGDGKELYKTFNDKMTTYTAYAGDIIQSAKKARPGVVACDEARDTTGSVERIAGLKNCSAKLAEVGDLPNSAFDAYVKSLTGIYAEYATTYEKVTALTAPLGAQYEEYKVLRDKLNASTKSLSTAANDYRDAVEKLDESVSVKDAAQALGKYLSEQQTK